MTSSPAPSADLVAVGPKMLRNMLRIRNLERQLTRLSQSGQLRGSLHLATGQEACPAGACAALRVDDYFTVTYRGHGYIVSKGCNLFAVVSEILGKQTGLGKGKGGKMHLTDLSHGLLGANGIVGGGVGTAAGGALASWIDGGDKVALTVFGDGTLNQGHVHEVLNIAALWKLPLIILCENNLYAEMTPLDRSTPVTELTARMAAYNIPAVKIDGNDPVAVYEAVKAAADRARAGEGPSFIEAMTYRICGHYQADAGTSYRTREEVAEWEAKDPIDAFSKRLITEGVLTPSEVEKLEADAEDEIAQVIEAALAAPLPDPNEFTEDMFL